MVYSNVYMLYVCWYCFIVKVSFIVTEKNIYEKHGKEDMTLRWKNIYRKKKWICEPTGECFTNKEVSFLFIYYFLNIYTPTDDLFWFCYLFFIFTIHIFSPLYSTSLLLSPFLCCWNKVYTFFLSRFFLFPFFSFIPFGPKQRRDMTSLMEGFRCQHISPFLSFLSFLTCPSATDSRTGLKREGESRTVGANGWFTVVSGS